MRGWTFGLGIMPNFMKRQPPERALWLSPVEEKPKHPGCDARGCFQVATCCPAVCVPVRGGKSPALKSFVKLQLCDRHAAALQPQDIINDKLRAILRSVGLQHGLPPLEFDHAFVLIVPLDHPDIAKFGEERVP